jgi:hypothetical protein
MQSLGNKNRPKFQPLANLRPSGIDFSFFCKIQNCGGEPPTESKEQKYGQTPEFARGLWLYLGRNIFNSQPIAADFRPNCPGTENSVL